MSSLLKYFIGKNGRIIVFALNRDGRYYNLLSIIEAFPDGMEPDREFTTDSSNVFMDRIKNVDSRADRVFFGVQNVTITQEMLERPQDGLHLEKSEIHNLKADFSEAYYGWFQRLNTSEEFADLLPKRDTSCRLKIISPGSIIEEFGDEKAKNKILKQLSRLMERNLGIDFSNFHRFLGSYLIVEYTPIVRNIHLRSTPKNDGVICRINYRTADHPLLRLRMLALDSDGKKIDRLDETASGVFLKRFKFQVPFKYIDLEVRDAQGELIDQYRQISFIKSISLDMGIKTKEVRYVLNEKDEDGNEIKKEKTVEKFIHEKSVVSGTEDSSSKNNKTDEIKSLFDSSPEYTYRKFENSLDFVFFDGDKKRINEIQARAKECVMRILNGTEKICYICDIFFTAKTFFEFLTEIKSLSPEIRILSSKEKLKENDIKALADMIRKSNKKIGHKIECRLLKGDQAALHDRIIVSDNKVWMIGCSLNEFGQRASTLIRVPKEYAPKIIQGVEHWWNDNSQSEVIDDNVRS